MAKYKPATGGRAPGDVREAFLSAVDAYSGWSEGEAEPAVEFRDKLLSISAACGLLWNCTDILPSTARYGLELVATHEVPKRRTYAAAARYLKGLIADAA